MIFKKSMFIFIALILSSCVSVDKEFNRQTVADTTEFEEVVKIESIEENKPKELVEKPSPKKVTTKKASVKKTSSPPKTTKKIPSKKATKVKTEAKPVVISKKIKEPRQPPLEDSEGFEGRRPKVIPYRIGEEIVLGISYFAVEAGKFTMKVEPFKQVNGNKSYHFKYLIQTSPLFNMFYKVDDVAETFVDYETLLPYSYEIHVDESKQIRETRTYFDHENNKATMWDSKKKPGKKVEKKKIEWDILSYSQNVFSAAYYLRNFTLKVGKELKVRVGHEGKNIVMTAKVLRKETIFTDVGKFETFVVQPKFNVEGKFKPVGENYLWLTADDRKFIVRLESKIKIGSIVGEVQKIKK